MQKWNDKVCEGYRGFIVDGTKPNKRSEIDAWMDEHKVR